MPTDLDSMCHWGRELEGCWPAHNRIPVSHGDRCESMVRVGPSTAKEMG